MTGIRRLTVISDGMGRDLSGEFEGRYFKVFTLPEDVQSIYPPPHCAIPKVGRWAGRNW